MLCKHVATLCSRTVSTSLPLSPDQNPAQKPSLHSTDSIISPYMAIVKRNKALFPYLV